MNHLKRTSWAKENTCDDHCKESDRGRKSNHPSHDKRHDHVAFNLLDDDEEKQGPSDRLQSLGGGKQQGGNRSYDRASNRDELSDA